MTEVIGIKFKPEGRVYFFDPEHIKYKADDMVIVETARGVECGTVASGNHFVDDASIIKRAAPICKGSSFAFTCRSFGFSENRHPKTTKTLDFRSAPWYNRPYPVQISERSTA